MSDYFQAAIPEPHAVLGLRLLPFSAGHIKLLKRLKNAFVLKDELPDQSDLFTAIWICSRNYADGVYCLEHPKEWAHAMGQWIRQYIERANTERKAKKKIPKFDEPPLDLAKACYAFRQYLAQGSSVPNFRPIDRGPSISFTLELELVQGVQLHLLREHIVRSEAEFNDRPWGQSLWDYYALKGLKGDCEIFDMEAIEQAQAVANRVQAIMEKRAQKNAQKKGRKAHGR